jgi:hypothetical protein
MCLGGCYKIKAGIVTFYLLTAFTEGIKRNPKVETSGKMSEINQVNLNSWTVKICSVCSLANKGEGRLLTTYLPTRMRFV